MSKINIRGLKDNSDDPTYRYKMERIVLKLEGKKTIISNLSKVAHDLGREEKEILTYFGKSLGCSTNYDVKGNKAILSKATSLTELEPYLFNYIDTYVLCETCGNPETKLEKKKKKISKICVACGAKSKITF